jgi:hypothetical protein
MYIILAYRKDSNFQIIHECRGPFSSHDAASKWAANEWGMDGVDEEGERTEGKYNLVVKFMEAPL